MQEDNKSLKTDSEMKEIMEIAVNDIKTAFIHIIHLIKKVKKNINIRKKQKMYKNGPNRKPSNKTCNTEMKNTLDRHHCRHFRRKCY